MNKFLISYLRMLSVILALCFWGSLKSLSYATDYDDLNSLQHDPYAELIDYCILDDDHVRSYDLSGPHYIPLLAGRYAEAVDSGRNYIEKSLKVQDVSIIRKPVSLYALALEMKGDFIEAMRWYGMLYPRMGAEYRWAECRMTKRMDASQHTPTCCFHKEDLFFHLCENIAQNYPLTVEDVDQTIEKISQMQEYVKSSGSSNLKSLYPRSMEGLDVFHTKQIDNFYGHPGLKGQVACSLYTLRDQCARFIRPNLHYGSNYNLELICQTRESYREFLAFMEEEYAKVLKQKEARELKGVRPEKFELYEEVMGLLRKMTELPY